MPSAPETTNNTTLAAMRICGSRWVPFSAYPFYKHAGGGGEGQPGARPEAEGIAAEKADRLAREADRRQRRAHGDEQHVAG